MDSPKRGRTYREYESFIPDVKTFYDRLGAPMIPCLRVNTLRITPLELTEVLEQKGYRVRPTSLADYLLEADGIQRPGDTLEAGLGYFLSQALTSAIPVMALDPKPDQFICDLCAAPGCKTTHMAQLMKNRGLIVGNDRKKKRLRALEHNVKKLGITNVATTSYAGQNFPRRWRFDRVLADVPCSGEGTYRFSASISHGPHRPIEGFLPKTQRALVIRAFDLLDDNGILVYSTCTYNPEENEGVIHHLLENRPAEVVPIGISSPHSPGLLNWKDREYDGQMERCWRIYPHQLNSVGFFVAKIRRKSSAK